MARRFDGQGGAKRRRSTDTAEHKPQRPLAIFDTPGTASVFWRAGVSDPFARWTSHYERLQRVGVQLPRVESLSDEQVTAKLVELIGALARLRVYLMDTNHLTDRELYGQLTQEALHDKIREERVPSDACFVLGLLPLNRADQLATYLMYYATQSERQDWQRANPGRQLPPRRRPPSERDRQLPKPRASGSGM